MSPSYYMNFSGWGDAYSSWLMFHHFYSLIEKFRKYKGVWFLGPDVPERGLALSDQVGRASAAYACVGVCKWSCVDL